MKKGQRDNGREIKANGREAEATTTNYELLSDPPGTTPLPKPQLRWKDWISGLNLLKQFSVSMCMDDFDDAECRIGTDCSMLLKYLAKQLLA